MTCDLSPVAALVGYLAIRGMQPGPLSMFQGGRYLTRQCLVSAVWDTLQTAGIDQSLLLQPQSVYRTAAARGMKDSVIKTLGRWRSLEYLHYVKIKIPREQLAGYSRVLAAQTHGNCTHKYFHYFALSICGI